MFVRRELESQRRRSLVSHFCEEKYLSAFVPMCSLRWSDGRRWAGDRDGRAAFEMAEHDDDDGGDFAVGPVRVESFDRSASVTALRRATLLY